MPARNATAQWTGDLKAGKGHVRLGSGVFSGGYGFNTRFGDEAGTNPEELIGAGLAACYAMALAAELGRAGHKAEKIDVSADTVIEKQEAGHAITHIDLHVSAAVPELDQNEFTQIATTVRHNCPVAKALAGTTINLHPRLTGGVETSA